MAALIGVRYIGDGQCPVRHGDRPFAPGELITAPEDLLHLLSGRSDFEKVYASDTPAPDAAHEEPAKE